MFKRFEHQRAPVTPLSPRKPARLTIGQVLDSCLDDIQVHHKRLSDCLQKYPSYADELRPLLTTALEIQAVPSVTPSAAFRRDLRQLLKQQSDSALQLPQPAAGYPLSRWEKTLVVLLVMAVISFFLLGAAAVVSNSLPGSPLYPIKRWTERIQVGLAEEADPALVHAKLERRLDEVKAPASHDETHLANQAASNYEGEINSAVDGSRGSKEPRLWTSVAETIG